MSSNIQYTYTSISLSWASPRRGERAEYPMTQTIILGKPSLLVWGLVRGEVESRATHINQMWLDSRGEAVHLGLVSRRIHSASLAAARWKHHHQTIVTRPGEIQTTGNVREISRPDYIKIINPQDTEVLDDPWLDGRTYCLEVGKRPMAYIQEEEGFYFIWEQICIWFQGLWLEKHERQQNDGTNVKL
jgi:hypothetical protein